MRVSKFTSDLAKHLEGGKVQLTSAQVAEVANRIDGCLGGEVYRLIRALPADADVRRLYRGKRKRGCGC